MDGHKGQVGVGGGGNGGRGVNRGVTSLAIQIFRVTLDPT